MLVIMNGNGTSRAGEPAGASRQRPAKSPRRILLVEDDGAIRRINAQVLVRSGYQVAAAQDGAAGWEALHANDFDLLITDHSMPGLSGLELVKKVRRARMTLPVILASGSLHTEELERHPWLQVAATLLKPIYAQQLLETVKEVLRAPRPASFGPEVCNTIPQKPSGPQSSSSCAPNELVFPAASSTAPSPAGLAKDPGSQIPTDRGLQQLDRAPIMHLLPDMHAMALHRARADVECGGNLRGAGTGAD